MCIHLVCFFCNTDPFALTSTVIRHLRVFSPRNSLPVDCNYFSSIISSWKTSKNLVMNFMIELNAVP